MQRLAFPSLVLAAYTLLSSCDDSTTTGPSDSNTSSHNAGRDCMACHGPGVGGEAPTWTVAGTVYRDDGATVYVGARVRLTTEPEGGGNVVAELTSDASGNFYTNRQVSFGGGLFADVIGTGARRSMGDALTRGACNSCHDVSNRLRAE